MGFLFNSKKETTTTPTNQFAGFLKDKYSNQIEQGQQGSNFLTALLTGTGDTAGAGNAWERFKSMAGFAPALQQLSRGITGQGAAAGLLNSGPTSRRLMTEGAQLNQGMYGNFLQQLQNLVGIGQNAGQLVSNAGSVNSQTTTSPSTGSRILSGIGSVLGIFSDRRVKEDIDRIAEFDDGLGIYTFRYIGDEELRIGVMADEVAEIRPWAMGPMVGPFQTVNYAAL